VAEFESIDVLLQLHMKDGIASDALEDAMKKLGSSLPDTFHPIELLGMSKENMNNARKNIGMARDDCKQEHWYGPK